MIITVGGIKGGSGKTTIATNLTVQRAAEGRDVLLVDADDQETASDFTMLRNDKLETGAGFTSIKLTGPAVRTEVRRLADKYDDIIIDTGGRDTTSQRAALRRHRFSPSSGCRLRGRPRLTEQAADSSRSSAIISSLKCAEFIYEVDGASPAQRARSHGDRRGRAAAGDFAMNWQVAEAALFHGGGSSGYCEDEMEKEMAGTALTPHPPSGQVDLARSSSSPSSSRTRKARCPSGSGRPPLPYARRRPPRTGPGQLTC